jgi:hypothetical protein
MSLLRSIASGFRSLFRKEQVSRELDEELTAFGCQTEASGHGFRFRAVAKSGYINRNIPSRLRTQPEDGKEPKQGVRGTRAQCVFLQL